MPIYLHFENGLHVETTTLPKKPDGAGWHKANADFAWEKRYKLIENGLIVERDELDVAQEFLQNSRSGALDTVRLILNTYRRKYVGYSPEKTRSYDVQEKTAKSIVASSKNNQTPDEKDVELIAPLAELRSITVVEMAQTILTKARKADRAIAKCENIEDLAQRKIAACTTLEELKIFMDAFEQDVQTSLGKL